VEGIREAWSEFEDMYDTHLANLESRLETLDRQAALYIRRLMAGLEKANGQYTQDIGDLSDEVILLDSHV